MGEAGDGMADLFLSVANQSAGSVEGEPRELSPLSSIDGILERSGGQLSKDGAFERTGGPPKDGSGGVS